MDRMGSVIRTAAFCGLLCVTLGGCNMPRPRFMGGSAAMPNTSPDIAVTGETDGADAFQPVSYSAPTQAELTHAGPFSQTTSGLSYRVLREGVGVKPRSTDRVRVHYHGWLDDGTVFDSSYDRGSPTSFRLDQVVPGWTEGLQYVAKGGKIELNIPSHLGYGAKNSGKIPPNSTLHFVVELIDINP